VAFEASEAVGDHHVNRSTARRVASWPRRS
jgi:hypothetical protein